MKLTKQRLKEIIKEELENFLEVGGGIGGGSTFKSKPNPQYEEGNECARLRRKKSKDEALSEEESEFIKTKCGSGPFGRK